MEITEEMKESEAAGEVETSKPKVTKPKRKSKKQNDEPLRQLEHVVFGDEKLVINEIEKSFQIKNRKDKKRLSKKDKQIPAGNITQPKAAWQDLDDEAEYENDVTVVRPSFHLSADTPKWARLKPIQKRKRKAKRDKDSDDEDDDEDDEDSRVGLRGRTGNYLAKPSSLSSLTIDLKKCTDANQENPSRILTALEFHPKSTVVLTADRQSRFNLFQVDGEKNRKIHSIFIDRFPITRARFSRDGLQVILGSGFSYFSYFDMESAKHVKVPKFDFIDNNKLSDFILSPDGRYIVFFGQYGYMHLMSSTSKEYLTSLKMNGSVDAAAFSKDGSRMFSFGSDGQVYVWDMNSRKCIHRFYDDGCVNGTAVCVSPNSKYIACGSDSGVVNIYDINTCMASATPSPQKAVMNLVTGCERLLFNHSSEILAASSNHSEKAVKLIHLPSMNVFRNFPDSLDHDITYPQLVDFSPNSGYFTIANNKGRALLYRVKHFENY